MRRHTAAALALAALAGVAAVVSAGGPSGCSHDAPARAGGRVQGARLVTATASDPKTFNPVLVTDQTSNLALAEVFEGLVRTDARTTLPEAVLAERWEWSDDGKSCTFRLRPGVQWHDGQPFTSADVVFTFDAIFDDKVPNSARFTLTVDGAPIRAVAVDDLTVRFDLPRPFAPFLAAVGVPILPKHLLGGALADGTFAHRWGIDTDPRELIGTGPYRMRRYVPAQLIEYDRNPTYWRRDAEGRRLPYLEGRVTLIVPEQNAISLRFLAGHTHYYNPRPEEIADLQDRAAALGIQVKEVGSDPGNLFVAFNRNPKHYARDEAAGGGVDPRLGWFTDKRFLRALAHAVDKRGMIETIFYGFGTAAVAYISEENAIFHDPEIEDYGYDLALAARLLDEAGYRDRDGDGWREDESGARVEFQLSTNAGNFLRERMCAILREDWTQLGIKVNYRPQTFQSLVERLNVTYDWDAILIGFTGSTEPNNGANFLRSSGNLHMWNPRQEKPATPWEAEIDRLLDAGSAELDVQKRARFYWRIQEILHEELPFLETVRQKIAIAYSDRLLNFEPTVWGFVDPERIAIAP
ncbi:MAG TPA: ABC transporter substrate-binding protein [Candidatus Binatia bacterium]|nr:ABC transporter substrate-binding protein [Candidatus Binatia bacterium]